jgi:hypothetical protein
LESLANKASASLDENAEYQEVVASIRNFFHLYGKDHWVEWAGSKLMPVMTEDLEDKRHVVEEVRWMEERAWLDRAKRDAAAASKMVLTVSAHTVRSFYIDRAS